jgi:hypothetical protein
MSNVRHHMTVVHVSPTAEELQAAERAVIARLRERFSGGSVQWWGGMAGGVLVGFALFALLKAEYPAHARSSLSVTATIGMLVLGAAIWYASAALGRNLISRRLYAEGSKLLKPYSLQTTAEGLYIQASGSSAKVDWSQVEEVQISDQQTLVFTAPTHALVVPARAFGSEHEYKEFVSGIFNLARGASEA